MWRAFTQALLAIGLLLPAAWAGEIAQMDQETLLGHMAKGPSDVVILDVRTAEEYAAGHIPGAINISHDQLAYRLGELEPVKSKEIVVYCRSGRRSNLALDLLSQNGFEHLAHLEGDMLAWQAENRALETSTPPPSPPATPAPGQQ